MRRIRDLLKDYYDAEGSIEPSATHLADFVIFDAAFPVAGGGAGDDGAGGAAATATACMADCGLEVWVPSGDAGDSGAGMSERDGSGGYFDIPFTTNVADIVTDENRCWPTFLHFSDDERLAMRVVLVFCDIRQEPCSCS